MGQLRSNVDQGIDEDSIAEDSRLAHIMVAAIDDNLEILVRLHALKSHDDCSFTHSLNVALMSLSIARQMQLPSESRM